MIKEQYAEQLSSETTLEQLKEQFKEEVPWSTLDDKDAAAVLESFVGPLKTQVSSAAVCAYAVLTCSALISRLHLTTASHDCISRLPLTTASLYRLGCVLSYLMAGRRLRSGLLS